jgi:hypothetical protein
MEMNEKKSSNGFMKLLVGARNLGLFLLGIGIYIGVIVLIAWLMRHGVRVDKLSVSEAVTFTAFFTSALHWLLFAFSA